MCRILLPINPEHVENILKGKKLFEFRKIRCCRNIKTIIIYATSPTKQVVGEVQVLETIVGKPEQVWHITSEHAGITKDFFDRYFRGKNKAVAYRLGKVKRYPEPLSLADFGLSHAPQSFVYIDRKEAVACS